MKTVIVGMASGVIGIAVIALSPVAKRNRKQKRVGAGSGFGERSSIVTGVMSIVSGAAIAIGGH